MANQALLPCSALAGPLSVPPASLRLPPSSKDVLEPLTSTLQPLGGSRRVASLRTWTQTRRAWRRRSRLACGGRGGPRRGHCGWLGRRSLRGGGPWIRCGSAESALLLGQLGLDFLQLLRQRQLLVIRQAALVGAHELDNGGRCLVPGKAQL